jgi:uncharacterized protein YneR
MTPYDRIARALEPFGFEDSTWHHDELPSVSADSVTVYVSEGGLISVISDGAKEEYIGEDPQTAINAALKAKG